MVVLVTGALTFNDDIIYIGTGTITSGKPAVVVNLIDANLGLSASGFFTIPNGKVMCIVSSNLNPKSDKLMTSRIYTHLPNGTRILGAEAHISTSAPFSMPYPTAAVNEKLDIEVRALLDSGTGEGDVALGYLLVDDDADVGGVDIASVI